MEPRSSGLGYRKSLKFLPGFEADSSPRRDIHLLPGARIAADAGLARLHIENAKAPEFNAFAAAEGVFHSFEDGFDGLFGFGSRNVRLLYDGIHEIELDHNRLHSRGNLC